MKLERRHSLSIKLLRLVLLWALLVGLILSLGQIAFDLRKERQQIDQTAEQILAMSQDPATQAVYSLDREMALQVIGGLFEHPAVRFASIGHPDETQLASRERPLIESPLRSVTDWLFGVEQHYSVALFGREPYNEYYGDLRIVLDTAPYGEDFLQSSLVILVSGILRAVAMALALYLLYHFLLTKPLAGIIDRISDINPDHPGKMHIPMLPGQERNELGLWINKANELLESIERNSNRRREAEANLLHMAQHDHLTGLPNRSMLQEQLSRILGDAGRRQRGVAVLCCGLDDFKEINEQFSYQSGDSLLVTVADRLRANSGRLGSLARLGGDQFALVQTGVSEPYEAAELAQTILDDLGRPFEIGDHTVSLRATIGITLFPDDGDNAEKLLQKAEQTMMLAKARSRNRYQFYIASLDSEMRVRRELDKELRGALERNEFHLVYQPQIAFDDHRVVGVEALVRWHHPERGLVPPDLFIPLAEQNGSIIEIGEWVLDQSCRQLRIWHDSGMTELRMAVNLSTVQLHHSELSRVVTNLIQRYKLPPRCLEMEVTETGLMEDISAAAGHLNSLKKAGVQIAIDDFGTGYSSLSYLRGLPLDKIKIDRSFVQDVLIDEDDATIVRAIIQLGRSLNMQVIAEGVESAEQEAYIIAQGCNEGQGYYYSRPLSATAFTDWLHAYEGASNKARRSELS
ncbi:MULTISPECIES: putative bifunctional diguanylate cyclase/phosphodiesterase [Halopseudomonas]|uniref:cyclic-guanylate-specific phosphodiesterase n=1 Tax=Halopseudomonas aestusnigri TaxID=857252 RepID=A0AAQ1G4H5_9GAMM|nr:MULTISPECIES: GGDEF domain-containing phosphodiesterase [Halopseudomonas]OWL91195.1 GGDEF-domain containing protein [Halopseudomonas aestusnigri]UGV29481.1 EAL domain-containing protein [Halopseudomonas aestusnigri]BDX19340.1 GGDEF-domain containing protein [Halopseudomonas aestusnigri]SEF61999.1 diguanylate cyclase (GGDEF) domain-containing protein [Halopseudomonas aestusnigri]